MSASSSATNVQVVPIEDIAIGPRLRAYRPDGLAELAASIDAVGLLHPITLMATDGGYRLVAGHHRLEACRRLGWTEISAIVLDLDEVAAELVEVEENLGRQRLTALERGEHLVRRSELLAAQGKRAQRGRPRKGVEDGTFFTTSDLAEAVEISERTAQRYMQVARDLPRDVRDLIRGSALAGKLGGLEELARVKKRADQREMARLIAAGEVVGVYQARLAIEQRHFACVTCGEVLDGYEYHHRRPYHCVSCGGHASWPLDASSVVCGRCGTASGQAQPTTPSPNVSPSVPVGVGTLPEPFYRKGGHKPDTRVRLPSPDEDSDERPQSSERAFKFADAVDALVALDAARLAAETRDSAVIRQAMRQLLRWLEPIRAAAGVEAPA